MRIGIQYSGSMEYNVWHKEYHLGDVKNYERCMGIYVGGDELYKLDKAIYECGKLQDQPYVLITTDGVMDKEVFAEELITSLLTIKPSNCRIYIENGIGYDKDGRIINSAFSKTSDLIWIYDKLNNKFPNLQVGLCYNIGLANLLGKNISGQIMTLGKRVRLIHANDNDGYTDMRQLPCTFTYGNKSGLIDWKMLATTLYNISYEGDIVFDIRGAISSFPVSTQKNLLEYLETMGRYYQETVGFKYILNNCKKLVLFGTGNMSDNYMRYWGNIRKPDIFIDNNSEKWGQSKYLVTICSPDTILDIEQEGRVVLICNCYHQQMRAQLEAMGVNFYYYREEFFLEREREV